MTRWIALLRGINVGGHHLVKMAELRTAFEDLGASRVHTVVQSGNVVFDHASKVGDAAALRKKIESALATRFGFAIPVLLLDATRFRKVAAAHPWAAAAAEAAHAHTWFLDGAPPSPDRAGLDALRSATEAWQLDGAAFYLHAPEGVGRSKLAAGAEKRLGVAATARNSRTVAALVALLDD